MNDFDATPTIVSCRAPYGRGGLGRHFAELVERARGRGTLAGYYSCSVPAGDPLAAAVDDRWARRMVQWTPVRWRPDARVHVMSEQFDRAVASVLRRRPLDGHALVGFVGKALHSFRAARAGGARLLGLHVGNSHVDACRRLHARAYARWPIERPWLGAAQAAKAKREYDEADAIWVNSAYTYRSFVEAGIPERRLRTMTLAPDARYGPQPPPPDDGVFRIVYVGSLTVAKGVPLLLDAFARLPVERAELRLVGGWSTPGMRRHVQAAAARDPRIRIAPGDPLPHFARAHVCVHPSFEDGFAYAPAEALACGVPVVVTEDTGMKTLVREGVDGFVVPTGDRDALVERLVHLHAHGPRRIASPVAPTA